MPAASFHSASSLCCQKDASHGNERCVMGTTHRFSRHDTVRFSYPATSLKTVFSAGKTIINQGGDPDAHTACARAPAKNHAEGVVAAPASDRLVLPGELHRPHQHCGRVAHHESRPGLF